MSQFKVGDVVQQINEPHSVGVVVKIGRRWLVHRWEPDYIVAKLETARYDNYFAEQIQAYAYKTVNKDDYTKHQTGDLITFHRKSSSGYPYLNTYYVGPKEDIRIIDDITFYPYINWEDHNVYYATYDWTGIQEIVKPKLQIGALVTIGSDKAFPIVKIVYDRPYETHVYTLENGSNISGKNLNNYDWNRETNSWHHKDVKPVVEPVKEVITEKQFKVGDVVRDCAVSQDKKVGIVTDIENEQYTVNWVSLDGGSIAAEFDWLETLTHRDSLKVYPYSLVPNCTDGRAPYTVLVVETGMETEFYQVLPLDIITIDGTCYYPYADLQANKLRYGPYHWKNPKTRIVPKFKIGQLIDDRACAAEPIRWIGYDIKTEQFIYRCGTGNSEDLELHESTITKYALGSDNILYSSDKMRLKAQERKKIAADLNAGPLKYFEVSYVDNPATKQTVLVTNPELAKKISGCKDSTGSVFVFGKEEFVGDPKAYKEQVNKTASATAPKPFSNKVLEKPILDNKVLDVYDDALGKFYILQEAKIVGSTDKILNSDYWAEKCKVEIGVGVGNVAALSKLELSAPSTNEYSDTFFNKHDQIEKTITSELLKQDAHIRNIFIENSVKDTEPKGVKMNLSPVNARVIRLRSVRLLDSLSKKFFLERFPDDVANFKIVGNLIDSKVPAALVLSLAGFSCKYGLPKAPTDIKPIVETLQKEFTEESQAMLTNSQLGVLKLIGDEVIASLISLVKEHVTDNDV